MQGSIGSYYTCVFQTEATVAAIQANSASSAEAAGLVVANAHEIFGFIDIIVNNAADRSHINLAAATRQNHGEVVEKKSPLTTASIHHSIAQDEATLIPENCLNCNFMFCRTK